MGRYKTIWARCRKLQQPAAQTPCTCSQGRLVDKQPKMGHYRPMSDAPGSTHGGLAAAVVMQIRAERAALDLPIGELADRVGVSRRAMTRYLNAEREITLGLLDRIAEALDTDLTTLLRRADERLHET